MMARSVNSIALFDSLVSGDAVRVVSLLSAVRRTRPSEIVSSPIHEMGLSMRPRRDVAMTLQGGRAEPGRREQGPEHTPRLRLKPKAPPTGNVDGAWWPRSDDLPNELPDLLAVLSVRLGVITRVLYNSTEWAKAPASLQTGGHEVQLEGSRPAADEHPRSNRNRRQEDPAGGCSPSVRPRHRTPGDDGRRGTEQRIDGRRPTGGQQTRAQSPGPGGCHRTGLDHTRLSVQIHATSE